MHQCKSEERKRNPPTGKREARGGGIFTFLIRGFGSKAVSTSTTRQTKPSEFDALAASSVARAERASSIQGAIVDETKLQRRSLSRLRRRAIFPTLRKLSLDYRAPATEKELEASRTDMLPIWKHSARSCYAQNRSLKSIKRRKSDSEKTNQSSERSRNRRKNGRPPLPIMKRIRIIQIYISAGHHHHGRSEEGVDHKIVSIAKT